MTIQGRSADMIIIDEIGGLEVLVAKNIVGVKAAFREMNPWHRSLVLSRSVSLVATLPADDSQFTVDFQEWDELILTSIEEDEDGPTFVFGRLMDQTSPNPHRFDMNFNTAASLFAGGAFEGLVTEILDRCDQQADRRSTELEESEHCGNWS